MLVYSVGNLRREVHMKNPVVFFLKFWAVVTLAQIVFGWAWLYRVFQGQFGQNPFDAFIARELVFGQMVSLGFAIIATIVWLIAIAVRKFKDLPATTLAV